MSLLAKDWCGRCGHNPHVGQPCGDPCPCPEYMHHEIFATFQRGILITKVDLMTKLLAKSLGVQLPDENNRPRLFIPN